jgi:hypothetical protein
MLGFKENKTDPMYNRRRFMAMSFAYAVIWGFCILAARILDWIDNAAVGLLLGYIATLSGSGIFLYFKGASDVSPKPKK